MKPNRGKKVVSPSAEIERREVSETTIFPGFLVRLHFTVLYKNPIERKGLKRGYFANVSADHDCAVFKWFGRGHEGMFLG